MKYIKTESKTSPLVVVSLNEGESIKLENGGMVYHNGKISLEGKKNGSLGGALMKKMFTGESFFITTATATENNGQIGIAPKGFGDISEIKVGETQWMLNDGVFLASDSSVSYTTKSQGIGKAMFGKTGGLFIIKTEGEGSMLINSFGSMIQFELDGTNDLVVDNGHVIGWEESVSYDIKMASGVFGFKTGEGLVCHFKGKGKVMLQSRNIENFAGILSSFLVSG